MNDRTRRPRPWTSTLTALAALALAAPWAVPGFAAGDREEGLRELIVLLAPAAPTPEDVVAAVRPGAVLAGGLDFLRPGDPEEARFLIPERARGAARERHEAEPDSPEALLQRYVVLTYPEGTDLYAVAAQLAVAPEVLNVEENVRVELSLVPDDPLFLPRVISPGPEPYEYQWGPDALHLPEAWDWAVGHSYVGVVDTGIDTDHEEFLGLYRQGDSGCFESNTGTVKYDRGNFRPHRSFDYGYQDCNVDEGQPQVENGQLRQVTRAGHGTHVSGIVAARANNDLGVAGACWECSLYVLKVSRLQSSGGNSLLLTANTVAGVYGAVERGVQTINLSAGSRPDDPDPCFSNPQDAWCIALDLVDRRDIAFTAAASNDGSSVPDFPAIDPRVFGVGGIEPGGSLWDDCPGSECGSNFDPNQFVTPAKQVLSTFYKGLSFNPTGNCDDSLLLPVGDGYGPCTGTSMSAPYLAGSLGILRSVNPLLSTEKLRGILLGSLDNPPGWNPQHGLGKPNVALAVQTTLGAAGGATLKNRLTPLFAAWSSIGEAHFYSTFPQMLSAAILGDSIWYDSEAHSPLIPGYLEFPGAHCTIGPCFWKPRASVYIFSTAAPPYPGAPVLAPLFRMSFEGAWGDNLDNRSFFWTTEEAGLRAAKTWGYDLDGREGYIFPRCTPEPSCIPVGAVRLYRLYSFDRDDYAIFPESELAYWQGQGYVSQMPGLNDWIGYVYENVDADGDHVIDGFERVLGTDPTVADTDCDGLSDGTEALVFPYSDPLDGSCGQVMGEAGKVTTLTHIPQTVVLSRSYANPVVFAQPVSRNGGNAAAVRVSNVLPDRFTFQIQEPPNLDGWHGAETVSYLVLEAGRWQLDAGAVLEVGKVTTSATVNRQVTPRIWHGLGFSAPFPQVPVVLSQVQTVNDPHWVKTRQYDATPTSVALAMEEEEAKLTSHGLETVGWLAMTAGAGDWSGNSYVAGVHSGVTDAWSVIPFAPPFAQPPLFVAGLGSYWAGDNSHVRYQGLTGTQVQVRVEEDTTFDAETTHYIGELVSYLLLSGGGVLEGTPAP